MKFFSPTSELKELLLLEHIEKNPNTTQKEIAKIVNGAISMVNVNIDKLEEKNYMLREYQSAKTVKYIITAEGIKRKNYLSIAYFNELIKLYRLAEKNIEDFLVMLENKGYKNILIYGAGEVGETLLGIAKLRAKSPLKVVALVDDDPEKQGRELLGYQIIGLEQIGKYNSDAIVITSYIYEDEIEKTLLEVGYHEERIVKFFGK